MADKFENFTERARKVLTLAQEEAHRFNHNYVGTEHLLLGLVREGDGVAARVLKSMGVTLPDVRKAVEFIIGRGDSMIVGEIGLTPRAKKVIELAVDEARRLNHHYIGTEHLLLGLIREGEGIAAGVLESMGVSLERVLQEVLQVLHATGDRPDIEQRGPEPLPPQRQALRAIGARLRREQPRQQPAPSLGDLRRIVAVNQTHIVDDVAATILSIELYANGSIAHGRLRDNAAEQIANYGPGRLQPHGLMLTDDIGTHYLMHTLRSTFVDDDSIHFSARFVPSIEIGAIALKLRLETWVGQEANPRHRQWEFEIEV